MTAVPSTTYTTIRKVYEFLNLYTPIGKYVGGGTSEAVGTGDGVTTVFNLANTNVVAGTDVVYNAGVSTTAYTIDADAGKITFTVAPNNGNAITADYWYSDIPSSVVGNYENRAEKEIDQRIGRSFNTSTTVTEFYDGGGDDATNPFSYEGLPFYRDSQNQLRPLDEKFYLNNTLQVANYPILAVNVLSVNNAYDQIFDTSNYTTDYSFGAANWICQVFKAGAAQKLIVVDIPIKYNTGVLAAITLGLYATTGSGQTMTPTGAALATSQTVTLTSSNTNYAYQRFTFATPYTLVNNTSYALVLSAPAASGTAFQVQGNNNASTLFTNGNYASSTNSGSSWAANSAVDLVFATWVSDILKYGDYRIMNNEGKIVLAPSAQSTSTSTTSSGVLFKKGLQNIVINYSYGYNTVPLIIEDLTTKMTAMYTIESRMLGSPVPLAIPKQNIQAIKDDIEYMFTSFGRKLEASLI